MTFERKALLIVSALLVLTITTRGCGRKDPVPHDVAVARTDQMIAILQDSGWVVQTAATASDLTSRLSKLEGDTTRLARQMRALAEQAQIAGAEVRGMAELRAEASTSLQLQAEQYGDSLLRLSRDPTYAGVARGLVDSVTAHFDDGVFAGRVSYYPYRSQFGLDFLARFGAALAITNQPDGRVLFAAIANDPRIKLTLENPLWSPPPPMQVCSIGTRLRWGLGGIVAKGLFDLVPR